MNKFDTETTTREYLTRRKKPDCVEILTELFDSARKEGLGLRQSYWYAETVHFLRDHNGHENGPELTIEETDENARQAIIDSLMATNDDGRAEERIDLSMGWYELFRSWGAGVALAFVNAAQASEDEWETANDLDEAEAIGKLTALDLDEDVADVLFKSFYAARNEGETVYASVRGAKEEAQEYVQRRVLFEILSGGRGGYVN
jgi:hypothetical protein